MSILVLRCDLRVLGDANSIAGSLFTFLVVVFDFTRSRHHTHCRVPCLAQFNSAMQSRSRTIMPMSMLHILVVVVHSLWLVVLALGILLVSLYLS